MKTDPPPQSGGGMTPSEKQKLELLEQKIQDLEGRLATSEVAGLVKLSASEAVTDSTGLALPAIEKNASIEGTMASKIEKEARKLTGHVPIYSSWLTANTDEEIDKEMYSLPINTVIISHFGINHGHNKILLAINEEGGGTGLLVGYKNNLYGSFIFFSYATAGHILKCNFYNGVYGNWYRVS